MIVSFLLDKPAFLPLSDVVCYDEAGDRCRGFISKQDEKIFPAAVPLMDVSCSGQAVS
jgi:hypothetical protein